MFAHHHFFRKNLWLQSALALWWLAGALPASAIDLGEPAQVRVMVQDAAGRPVPNAVVTLRPDMFYPAEAPVRHNTDQQGVTEFALRRPQQGNAASVSWSSPVHVEQSGYLAERTFMRFFPGARIEQRFTLDRRRSTLIRLRGAKGRALAYVDFQLTYAHRLAGVKWTEDIRGHTNADGDYRFDHPPLDSDFWLSVGTWIHPGKDVREVTVTVPDAYLTEISPGRRLSVTLLAPDGAPAAGWLVAQHVNAMHFSARFFMGYTGAWEHSARYTAHRLVRVGPDGKFSVYPAEPQLIVVSPHGTPLLFPLNPMSWQGGTRHVTLRLPAVERVQEGQVVYQNGTPAAGLPIAANKDGFMEPWSLEVYKPGEEGAAPLWQAKAADGSPVGGMRTDATGHFALPIYFGQHTRYNAINTDCEESNDLETNAKVVLKPAVRKDLSKVKRITLSFVDARGQRIPDMIPSTYNEYRAGEERAYIGGGAEQDLRGATLFVDADVDQLSISTTAVGWNPLNQTLDLPGPGDRTFNITVPETLRAVRLLPLKGRLLDSDGKPVAGASIELSGFHHALGANEPYYTRDPETDQWSYYRDYGAETDLQGWFRFKAAPDNCEITMRRYDPGSGVQMMPGWTEKPPEVSPQNRNMVIRLRCSGSVRVLIPDRSFARQRQIFLRSLDLPDTDWSARLYPVDDVKTLTMKFLFVRPGRYVLASGAPELHGVMDGENAIPVVVEAGKESVVDLRSSRFSAKATGPIMMEVTVTFQGKPMNGAIVTLIPDPAEPEVDSVAEPPGDLCDDSGKARFSTIVGRRYVVEASVPGQFVGRMPFTASRGQAVTITLDRVPALTLPTTTK